MYNQNRNTGLRKVVINDVMCDRCDHMVISVNVCDHEVISVMCVSLPWW